MTSAKTDGWESASVSEDEDEDGEWVDVHHSSDEDATEVVGWRTSLEKRM